MNRPKEQNKLLVNVLINGHLINGLTIVSTQKKTNLDPYYTQKLISSGPKIKCEKQNC